MNVSPKDNIMGIMGPIINNKFQQNEIELVERISHVCKILRDHPELRNDKEVNGCLLSATENSVDEKVIQFRRSLLDDNCLPVENKTGLLSITKDKLNQLTADDFWTYIEKQRIKSLVIFLGDGSETYEKGFLKLLLDNKPPLADLTDMYTLQFKDGIIEIPKAKLRLCGEYFEKALNSAMAENTNKTFEFKEISRDISEENLKDPEPPIKRTAHTLRPIISSNKVFSKILCAIETEEYDFDKYDDEFKIAAEYLGFSVSLELPEEFYGQEEWEKYWGNIGVVPLPPKELLDALKGPCPICNKEGIPNGPRMGDTHVIFWRPPTVDDEPLTVDCIERIAASDKFGENKLKNYYQCPSIISTDPKVNQPIKEGYWFAMPNMPNDFVENTRNMTYEQQKTYLEQNLQKEYGFPTVCEALIYCLMPRARTGAFVLGTGDPWTLTRCREEVDGKHVNVGGGASSGLFLDRYTTPSTEVCVVPVRRFFKS